jgi:small ubiquitin-related modifier
MEAKFVSFFSWTLAAISKRHLLAFKVKKHTPFQKIFDAYINKLTLDKNAVRFKFDGANILGTQTPDGLEMEDGDVIDVVMSQIGGCM